MWDGSWRAIRIRRSNDDEAARWEKTIAAALAAGESSDPGYTDDDFYIYLLQVRDPAEKESA